MPSGSRASEPRSTRRNGRDAWPAARANVAHDSATVRRADRLALAAAGRPGRARRLPAAGAGHRARWRTSGPGPTGRRRSCIGQGRASRRCAPLIFYPPLYPYFLARLLDASAGSWPRKWAQAFSARCSCPRSGCSAAARSAPRVGLAGRRASPRSIPSSSGSPSHFWVGDAVPGAALVGLRAAARRRRARAGRPRVAAGLLLGLAILTRETSSTSCPSPRCGSRWRAASAGARARPRSCSPRSCVVAPWTYRNWVVFRAFVPVSTAGGLNLFQGNARLTRQEVYDRYGAVHGPHRAVPLRAARWASRRSATASPRWLFEKLREQMPMFWEAESLALIHIKRGAYGRSGRGRRWRRRWWCSRRTSWCSPLLVAGLRVRCRVDRARAPAPGLPRSTTTDPRRHARLRPLPPAGDAGRVPARGAAWPAAWRGRALRHGLSRRAAPLGRRRSSVLALSLVPSFRVQPGPSRVRLSPDAGDRAAASEAPRREARAATCRSPPRWRAGARAVLGRGAAHAGGRRHRDHRPDGAPSRAGHDDVGPAVRLAARGLAGRAVRGGARARRPKRCACFTSCWASRSSRRRTAWAAPLDPRGRAAGGAAVACPPPYFLLLSALPPPLYPAALLLCGAAARPRAAPRRRAGGAARRPVGGWPSGALWPASRCGRTSCPRAVWRRPRPVSWPRARGAGASLLAGARPAPRWRARPGGCARSPTPGHAVVSVVRPRTRRWPSTCARCCRACTSRSGGLLGTHVPARGGRSPSHVVCAPRWAAGALVLVYGALLIAWPSRQRRAARPPGLLLAAAALALAGLSVPAALGPGHDPLPDAAVPAASPRSWPGASRRRGRSPRAAVGSSCWRSRGLHLVGAPRACSRPGARPTARRRRSCCPTSGPCARVARAHGIRRAYASYGPAYRLTLRERRADRRLAAVERALPAPPAAVPGRGALRQERGLDADARRPDRPAAPRAFEDAARRGGRSLAADRGGRGDRLPRLRAALRAAVEPLAGAGAAGDGDLGTALRPSPRRRSPSRCPRRRRWTRSRWWRGPRAAPAAQHGRRGQRGRRDVRDGGAPPPPRRARGPALGERPPAVRDRPRPDRDPARRPHRGRRPHDARGLERRLGARRGAAAPGAPASARAPWDEWLDPDLSWRERAASSTASPGRDREDWYWRLSLPRATTSL